MAFELRAQSGESFVGVVPADLAVEGVSRRGRIEDAPSADGCVCTQDDPVARGGDDGGGEPQLREASRANDARERRRRAVMYQHPCRDRCAELLELDVEPVARRVRIGCDEHIAASELGALDSREGHGDALSRLRDLDGLVVHLHAAHSHSARTGLDGRTSPAAMRPDQSVPVATVPIPRSVKTRST